MLYVQSSLSDWNGIECPNITFTSSSFFAFPVTNVTGGNFINPFPDITRAAAIFRSPPRTKRFYWLQLMGLRLLFGLSPFRILQRLWVKPVFFIKPARVGVPWTGPKLVFFYTSNKDKLTLQIKTILRLPNYGYFINYTFQRLVRRKWSTTTQRWCW